MDKTRFALIPAYKPQYLLIDLLVEVQAAGFSAVVIDDGGGEAFAEIFEKAAAYGVVLTHPQNRGKGRAIKTGLEYIEEHFSGDAVVVTLDADGQHTVPDAIRVCEEAEKEPEALILGSRALKENVPLRSRFGNSVTRTVFTVSTGVTVHDTQTGLRAFSVSQLPDLLAIEGERYEYEMNVLLEYTRMKKPIREILISTIYIDDNSGSHFSPVKDSFRIYKEILKFSASSIACFLLDYGLYILLTVLQVPLEVSNIVARIISAGTNFAVNRRFVFKSKKSLPRAALEYAALAAVIITGNTAVLHLFVKYVGINPHIAKLLCEIIFFTLSFSIQRLIIFRKR